MELIIAETKKSSYRTGQIHKIKKHAIYHIKIKFYDTGGNTNYLDITNSEFDKIKNILTNQRGRQ